MTRIDYSELTSVQQTVQRARLAILDHFTPFNSTIEEFSSESELTGDSWESAKTYINQVPPVAKAVFNTLAEVGETLDIYLSSFKADVGSPKNRLDSDKLSELNERLKSVKREKEALLEQIRASAKLVQYGPQSTMFGTSYVNLGNAGIENTMADLNKDIEILEKYVTFEAAHASDFSAVENALTQLKLGLGELNRNVSFQSTTGNFSSVSLKDKTWYQSIETYNKTQPGERLEMVKVWREKKDDHGRTLGYEIVYDMYKDGSRDSELSAKMTEIMKKAQIGEFGTFLLETTGINDFRRYFNGVDPVTGETLTNNQKALSGLLGLLSVVSVVEGAKMLKNLQNGYSMMKNVDIADDLAKTSLFGPMMPEDAARYKQFWDDVAAGKTVNDRMGLDPLKLQTVGKQPYKFNPYDPDPAKTFNGSGKKTHPLEWNQTIDSLRNQGVEVVEKGNGTMGYAPKTDFRSPQLNLDGSASYSALMHEQQHYLDDLANGFPGPEFNFTPINKLKSELNAYLKEIRLAEQVGNRTLASQLYENYLRERALYFPTGIE